MAQPFTDNFDSYSDGDLNGQGGWSGHAAFDIQGTTVQGGSKAVKIIFDAGTKTIAKSGALTADGDWIIYMRVSGLVSDQRWILQLGEGGTLCYTVRFYWDGTLIQSIQGGSWTTITTYSANTWHKIRVQWRSSDKKHNVTIDDSSSSGWVNGAASFTNGIDKLELIQSSDSATESNCFADTISASINAFTQSVTEAIALAENLNKRSEFIRSITDSIVLSEIFSSYRRAIASLTDNLYLKDKKPPEKYALSFDGIDDYIEINDSPSLDIADEITIEAWVKSNVASGSLTKLDRILEKNNSYAFDFNHDAWGKGNFGLNFTVGGFTDLQYLSNLPANTWLHLVATYDGSVMKIYLNGVLDNSVNVSKTIVTNAGNAYIGTYGTTPTGTYNFSGIIDEVRVYNRALSANEVLQHYRGTFANETGLVGLWHFNEGSGNTANDSSASVNNGTITGAVYTYVGDVFFTVRVFFKNFITDIITLQETVSNIVKFKMSFLENINLFETFNKTTRLIMSIVDRIQLAEIFSISTRIWTFLTKNTASWVHQNKSANPTWTNQSKSADPTWDWQDKP